MTLPKLRVDQHAQILGISIIGYGVSFLLYVVGPLLLSRDLTRNLASGAKGLDIPTPDLTDYFTPWIVSGLIAFVFCGVVGLIIRNAYPDPTAVGVVFAILSFGFFPLGTILSVYTLIYVFVIYDREEDSGTDHELKLN